MFQNSHFILRAVHYRIDDLRRAAAADTLAEATIAERRRARREAALARLRAAAAAKQESAVLSWQNQNRRFGFRSAR